MIDPITQRLHAKMERQKEKGLSKYGQLLSDANLSEEELIEHAIEETIDKLFYLEALLAKKTNFIKQKCGKIGQLVT